MVLLILFLLCPIGFFLMLAVGLQLFFTAAIHLLPYVVAGLVIWGACKLFASKH